MIASLLSAGVSALLRLRSSHASCHTHLHVAVPPPQGPDSRRSQDEPRMGGRRGEPEVGNSATQNIKKNNKHVQKKRGLSLRGPFFGRIILLRCSSGADPKAETETRFKQNLRVLFIQDRSGTDGTAGKDIRDNTQG